MKDNGPTTKRFVAVLNKKIETRKALNALGHMSVGLATLCTEQIEDMRFQVYVDKDGGEHKNISDNPFIILKADNSNKIRTLRNELLEKGVRFTDFTETMIVGTYLEQHQRTNNTSELELEYFGICFFADDEVAKELTKKFSLYN